MLHRYRLEWLRLRQDKTSLHSIILLFVFIAYHNTHIWTQCAHDLLGLVRKKECATLMSH